MGCLSDIEWGRDFRLIVYSVFAGLMHSSESAPCSMPQPMKEQAAGTAMVMEHGYLRNEPSSVESDRDRRLP